MKKFLSLVAVIIMTGVYAQQGFGIKAGLTYNADDGLIKSANSAYQAKGEGSAGYHLGVYKRLSFTGLYVQPELWYVNFKNTYKDTSAREFDVQIKRIDVPVSLGTNVLGIGYVQAGPVFSYYFQDEIDMNQVSDIKQDDIALGLQIGAGVQLQQFSANLRYDFPMGKRSTEWVQNSNYNFQTESSPKLLHLSIGYSF
ncbi:MAG: PorT family protein [Flavobacteriaceae bacterium]|nr:PorT family protein [Flavobacteriaceae bacterium]